MIFAVFLCSRAAFLTLSLYKVAEAYHASYSRKLPEPNRIRLIEPATVETKPNRLQQRTEPNQTDLGPRATTAATTATTAATTATTATTTATTAVVVVVVLVVVLAVVLVVVHG